MLCRPHLPTFNIAACLCYTCVYSLLITLFALGLKFACSFRSHPYTLVVVIVTHNAGSCCTETSPNTEVVLHASRCVDILLLNELAQYRQAVLLGAVCASHHHDHAAAATPRTVSRQ